MPKHLLHAFLAAEDRNFFNHNGISYKGILRSILVNLYHRKKVQGASTITQQLIRLLYFDSQKTFQRKIQEQLIALIVEQQFTKEQIFETYLNHIYFGCGIYGVQAAAHRFWALDVQELSPAQGATLAAIVRSPNYYCPLLHPDHAISRRNMILSLMHQLGYLNNQEYENALKEPLALVLEQDNQIAPHLKETIRQEIESIVGRHTLYHAGLKVQTTLNREIQNIAEDTFITNIKRLKKELHQNIDGGLITFEVSTGEIKALVGGYNYTQSQFNRATQARRQLGSSIKPIIYANALQQKVNNKKVSFKDTEIDEPITVTYNNQEWQPRNNHRRFEGQMTLAYALSRSNNIITIKTLLKYGIEKTIELAHKMGIKQELPPYPSLSLGCIDVTLMEATGTFNTFAHNGCYIKPHYTRWVKDAWGTKIWRYKPESTQAMEAKISHQVVRVLMLSLQRVCSALGIELTFEAFYKTGTTNDSRNCWILGSTPQLTTGIYLGTDDNQSLGENIYAIRTAFPLWYELNAAVGSYPTHFSYDSQLKEISVDAFTGKIVEPSHRNALPILIEKEC